MTFQPKPAGLQNFLIFAITYTIFFYLYGFDSISIIAGLLILPYGLYLTIFGLAVYVTLLQDKMIIELSFSRWLAEKGIRRERKIEIRYGNIYGLDKTRWLLAYDMLIIHEIAGGSSERKFSIFWKILEGYDRFEEELLRRVPLNCKIMSAELKEKFARIRQVRTEG